MSLFVLSSDPHLRAEWSLMDCWGGRGTAGFVRAQGVVRLIQGKGEECIAGCLPVLSLFLSLSLPPVALSVQLW